MADRWQHLQETHVHCLPAFISLDADHINSLHDKRNVCSKLTCGLTGRNGVWRQVRGERLWRLTFSDTTIPFCFEVVQSPSFLCVRGGMHVESNQKQAYKNNQLVRVCLHQEYLFCTTKKNLH
jgi:hypothetical protein